MKRLRSTILTGVAGLAFAMGANTTHAQPPQGQFSQGQRQPAQGNTGEEQPERIAPIVLALDLNGDRTISSDEIAQAYQSLKKLDSNGDGVLTANEFRAQGAPDAPGQGRANSGPGQGRGPGQGGGAVQGRGQGMGPGQGRGPGQVQGMGQGQPRGPGMGQGAGQGRGQGGNQRPPQ